jgi:diguanylate cyclase (GGDEF)-like protein
MGNMTHGVDGEEPSAPTRPGVSGAVVHALVWHVRRAAGEAGVAQALALAAEERPFPALGDAGSWTSSSDAAALFAAGALVTGDGAIGLHVGEEILWVGDDPPAGHLASLGSPEVAVRHIGTWIEQYEGATEAVALEVGPGRALVEVATSGGRQAHLCELTRGMLSRVPVLFGGAPARVVEHSCAARGGPTCRYMLSWEIPPPDRPDSPAADLGRPAAPGEPSDPSRRVTASPARYDSDGRPVVDGADGSRGPHGTGGPEVAAGPSGSPDPAPVRAEDATTVGRRHDHHDVADEDAPFGRDPASSLGTNGSDRTGATDQARVSDRDGRPDTPSPMDRTNGSEPTIRAAMADPPARRERPDSGGGWVTVDRPGGGPPSGSASGSFSDADADSGIRGPTAEKLAEELRAARAALVEAQARASRWETAAHAGRSTEDDRRRAEAEAERSRAEVARFQLLLEGSTSSTLELLDHDLDLVVSDLADRADQVLGADRYLLMLRAGSGMSLDVFSRGLTHDEVRELAADLWGGHPDQEVGTRLVADIASPMRRYGRIAEFLAPGEADPETEERVLTLFARYAANVLDVCTVLGDARRSDSTARTLLSFSEQLSGLTNLAQALQILADTVPEVTGCDQSTVYLWDRDRSRLVLGAYTSGMPAPDADLSPIVPDWPTASATQIHVGPRPDGTEPDPGALRVEADNPLIQRMISAHEVLVLDADTVADPQLATLMEASGVPASVVAPLFAAAEFLGVIAANFSDDASRSAVHDPDLHERLCGLADQAATAIQNLELLEKVSHMAWHDSLTGLPNRRLFEDRVEQELVRSRRVGEPVCMFFVDLDNFKTVNDTFGHATGDLLIQQVGQRLVETVRSQDTVARVGGDEFAILLPGLVDQLSINQLAERTLDAMHTPFDIYGELVSTSASVGIAIAPEHGDSYDDLLNRADEAMYRAKDLGRDAFEMFHHSPDPAHPGRRAVDDRQLYNDLIAALDGNQFFLLYQPYIDLRTAQIVGVEALIRWDHPTLGILEPPHFIPMAEKSELIVSLDNWVLWQACRQLRSWQDHDLDPLRLSVNVASRDLSNPDFFESVSRTLHDTGIEPSLLELEITDRVVLDRSGPAQDNIDQLRRLGVRFTIDDFGQGNSSLDRIGSFPVSTLKIDQSFVQVLGPSDEESSLVSAIIGMAGRLGLSCVAEGVETLLQSRVLLQRGCTTAQGYYFSPPLPPEGVEEMLASLTPAEVPDSFGEPPNGKQPPA